MVRYMRRGWPAVLGTAAGFIAGTVLTRHVLHRQVAAARALAEQDPLTGLPNRRALLGEVHTRLAARAPTVLVLIDLDDFKAVNDTHGHLTGDDMLTTVAERMVAALRRGGYVARLAGDEFVLLLDDDTDPAATVAAVLTALSQPVRLAGVTLRPRASAGVSAAGPGVRTWRQLIAGADRALYRAKATGTRVVVDNTCDAADTAPVPPPQRRRNRH